MKLSEAIREGSKMGPQLYGKGRAGNATCAMGAALLAVGMGVNETDCRSLFPIIGNFARCPMCENSGALVQMVVHLNDHHRITREAIAMWVESEENDSVNAKPLAPFIWFAKNFVAEAFGLSFGLGTAELKVPAFLFAPKELIHA